MASDSSSEGKGPCKCGECPACMMRAADAATEAEDAAATDSAPAPPDSPTTDPVAAQHGAGAVPRSSDAFNRGRTGDDTRQ